MSGMHQSVSQEVSFTSQMDDSILHAIDFEDVALSREGVRLVHRGAKAVLQQFMPAADSDNLTVSQAIALFVDQIFWVEESGGLIMCSELVDRHVCLPIPKTHWTVRTHTGMAQ